MSRKHTVVVASLLILFLVVTAPGCKSKSELEKALEERQRWDVLALNWTQNAEQVVMLSTRLSGPPNAAIEQLSVRVTLTDAAGAQVDQVWHVYDLSEVPRGGPKDITIRIPADQPVEGLSLDPVPYPTAEERADIEELRGLADPA